MPICEECETGDTRRPEWDRWICRNCFDKAHQRIEKLERLGNRAYQIIDFVRDKVAYHFSLDMGLRMNLICEALREALPEQLPEQETP